MRLPEAHQGRSSAPLSGSNTLIGDRIFIERCAGRGCDIGRAVRSFGKGQSGHGGECRSRRSSLGESAQLKLAAKIYGPSTIGPHCKVGGEVNNSVIMGCEQGARWLPWQFGAGRMVQSGCRYQHLQQRTTTQRFGCGATRADKSTDLQFWGLIMGDHSRRYQYHVQYRNAGGSSSNIFGGGFPGISFPPSAGAVRRATEYRFDKAMETAEKVMGRRGIELDEVERASSGMFLTKRLNCASHIVNSIAERCLPFCTLKRDRSPLTI